MCSLLFCSKTITKEKWLSRSSIRTNVSKLIGLEASLPKRNRQLDIWSLLLRKLFDNKLCLRGLNLRRCTWQTGYTRVFFDTASSFLVHQYFHILQKISSNASWPRVRFSKSNFILWYLPPCHLQTKYRHYDLMKSRVDLRNEQSDPVSYVTQVFTNLKRWRTT